MPERFDVVVAGGGLAGATAARALAERGVRVLLAERKADPGALNYCAEAVSARAIAPFGPIDDELVAAPIDAGLLVGPQGASARLLWPAAGYVLHRDRLMRRVFERAAAAGADARLCHDVAAVVRDGLGTLVGVRVRGPEGEALVACAAVIAADGIASAVGRQAGIPTRLPVRDVLSSAQYRMVGVGVEPGTLEFWIGDGVAPGGYAWVFPRAAGEANVGVGIVATRPSARGTTATDWLKRFRRERFQGHGKIVSYITGGIPIPRRLSASSAQGVVLAGDAARVPDPLSAAGIAEAMQSATCAAQAVAEGLAAGDLSARQLGAAARAYARRTPRRALMARIRQVFDRLDDGQKRELVLACRAAFHERSIQGADPRGLFLALLRAHPRLIGYVRYLVRPA